MDKGVHSTKEVRVDIVGVGESRLCLCRAKLRASS
jgi:hypothetical protein